MNFRILLIIFVVFPIVVWSRSETKPETKVFSLIAVNVGIFRHENRGMTPKSWKEMIDGGYLTGEILEYSRKNIHLEKRYGLFERPIKINDGSGDIELIALAVESGAEGNQSMKEVQNGISVIEGRMAIVSSKGELARSRRYSENMLRRLFLRAGYDLDDYTGLEGKWVNRDELRLARLDAAAVESTEPESGQSGATQSRPEREKKNNVARETTEAVGTQRKQVWFGVGLLTIGVFVWLFISIFIRKEKARPN